MTVTILRAANLRNGLSNNNMLEYGKENFETGTVKPITEVNSKLDKRLLIGGFDQQKA
jgi:hypothetical protein